MQNCPSCARGFSSILEYPRLYIEGVERSKLPELVPGRIVRVYDGSAQKVRESVPRQVLEQLTGDTKTASYDGHLWFRFRDQNGPLTIRFPAVPERRYELDTIFQAQDKSKEVHELYAAQPLQDYLASLESLVGKEVQKASLFPAQARKGVPILIPIQTSTDEDRASRSVHWLEGDRYFASFREQTPKDNSRVAALTLIHGKADVELILPGKANGHTATLATICYEGRVNPIPTA